MKLAGAARITILLIAALLSMTGVSRSQPAAASDLERAAELYRSGDYTAAISMYRQLLQQGWTGGELHYNLGNCYYKLGQYGQAILHYERARRFLGGDRDLQVNLKLANLRISDRIEPLPRLFIIRIFEALAGFFPVRRWAQLFLLAEWVLLGCLIALHLVRKPRWRRPLVAGFLVFAGLAILTGGLFLQQKIQAAQCVEGVVLADKVEVRSAPEAGSTELFALHEGVKMRVLRQVSGWAEIRLADGKQGWMPQTAFEII